MCSTRNRKPFDIIVELLTKQVTGSGTCKDGYSATTRTGHRVHIVHRGNRSSGVRHTLDVTPVLSVCIHMSEMNCVSGQRQVD